MTILLFMILKLFYLKLKFKKTDNLNYTNKYIPVSFSIFSNIEGFNVKPIHKVNNDPKMLIELFVSNLREISEKSYEINVQKYKDIYKQIYNLEEKNRCQNVLECLINGFVKFLSLVLILLNMIVIL